MSKKIFRPTCITELIRQVASEHNIDPEHLTGRNRGTNHLAAIRHELWGRIRLLTGPGNRPFSFPQIGLWFDRDQATIRYGVHRYNGVAASEYKRKSTSTPDEASSVRR